MDDENISSRPSSLARTIFNVTKKSGVIAALEKNRFRGWTSFDVGKISQWHQE